MASKSLEDGSSMTSRNKAIAAAICKHLSLDPKNYSSEIIEGYDILNLSLSILSAGEVPLKDYDEVMKWITFANNFPSGADARIATLKGLNDDLSQRAVLLGDGFKPSAIADIVVFCALHSFLVHLVDKDMQKFPNVIRWMDYIQNKEDFGDSLHTIVVSKPDFEHFCSKSIDKVDNDLSVKKVAQDTKNVDKLEGSINKKKDAPERKANVDDKTSVPTKSKKGKEEKKKPKEKETTEKETEASVNILNIQVGVIRKAWKHPSADSLLVEEIDVGDGKLRQVVSGLAKYCSPDQLSNRRVALITNVKPGKLRDVMSSGLKNYSSEIIEGYDILNLSLSILSAGEVPLKDYDEVMKWITFANNFPSGADARIATLKGLNDDLSQRAVLLGDGFKPSAIADIVVFCALHSFLVHLVDKDMQKFPNVIRWMDYIQNKEDFGDSLHTIVVSKPDFEHFCSKSIDKVDNDLSVKKVAQDTKNVDKLEGSINKKKDAPERKANVDDKTSVPTKSKKGKEEKKKPKEKETTEKETEASVNILNIQVGVIRKAWKHPSADSLLVEEIDVGDGKLRQVVSGLAKYCSPDQLSNRRVALITNVKPGKLRDVMSSGLVLCASTEDHTKVEPLIPPEGAIPGERISFSGYEGKPEEVLNPKKKQLEKITPDLYTDDKGVATYKGIPFMTSAGPCTCSIPKASIK